MDYITLPQTRQGKRHVLTMVEATTGWLETYPVPHATAWNTILGLEKQRIQSDNGTHFRNNLKDTWAKEHGIEWVYHIPYHAPATVKMERYNGLLKTTLKATGEPGKYGREASFAKRHGLKAIPNQADGLNTGKPHAVVPPAAAAQSQEYLPCPNTRFSSSWQGQHTGSHRDQKGEQSTYVPVTPESSNKLHSHSPETTVYFLDTAKKLVQVWLNEHDCQMKLFAEPHSEPDRVTDPGYPLPPLPITGIQSSSQNQNQEPLPLAQEGGTQLWASGCLFILESTKGTPASNPGSCASTPCASGGRRQPDNQKKVEFSAKHHFVVARFYLTIKQQRGQKDV
ncbi:hypothetical protein QYF61_015180, partial [Mycteria americana]